MTTRGWSRLFSILVFALALATTGNAQAQFACASNPGDSFGSSVGWGYGIGTVHGFSPFDYGSFGAANYGGLGVIRGFPHPGYGRAIGRRPQTITSYQSVSDVVTLVPGWNGSAHRVRRRH